MQEKSPVEKGWEFSAHIIGANAATTMGSIYVNAVEEAITKLQNNINNTAVAHGALGIDQLQGFVYEEFAAGTFNVDAIAAGSRDRAVVLHENGLNSVDIHLKSGKDYSAKSYKTVETTVKAQAKYDRDAGHASYEGQERLSALSDKELKEAETIANHLAGKNSENRPEVAEAYSDTVKHLKNKIENDEGVSSRVSTRKENAKMAEEAKEGKFNAEDHDITVQNSIKTEYIVKQALKAGYTAAVITMVTQLAPEIYKAIDFLIKNGELDPKEILRLGEKGISAGAEGFLRGSISSSLTIMCESGKLGAAFVGIPAPVIGTMTVLAMQTIKNSILVAAGKMTPKQMGEAFVDTVVISSGFIAGNAIGEVVGAAAGKAISAIIGQTFLPIAQVVGFLLGSLIGTAFSVVYNIGKKKLISFCVDTGFTCFGLVEQDYQLPEEVLNSMGINTIKISQTPIHQTRISTTQISQAAINRQSYETIGFTMPRRGIIGVNKVGYVV